MQAGVSEDDIIPASSEFDANSRYNIPDELSFTHQAVKHPGDHFSLDSHSVHLSAHPIPFPGMKNLLLHFDILISFVCSLITLII